MDGFQRRTEKKKESIRQAALRLFRAHGFRRVSIADIAREAVVSPVSIYNYFGSKDGLIRDVVDYLIIGLIERYRGIIHSGRPFLEKVETIIFDKQQILAQYQGELAGLATGEYPDMRQYLENKWYSVANDMMVELMEMGKADGYVNPELSPEALLVYIQIIRRGFGASIDLFRQARDPVRLMADLQSMFVYGPVEKKGWR